MPFSPLTGPPGVISLLHSPKPSPPHPSAPPLHAPSSVALLCSVVEEMKRRLCRLLFPHESAPKCLPSLSFLTLKRMVLNVHWPLPSSLPAASTHHRDPIKGAQSTPSLPTAISCTILPPPRSMLLCRRASPQLICSSSSPAKISLPTTSIDPR
jgi:hypothetical protein